MTNGAFNQISTYHEMFVAMMNIRNDYQETWSSMSPHDFCCIIMKETRGHLNPNVVMEFIVGMNK